MPPSRPASVPLAPPGPLPPASPRGAPLAPPAALPAALPTALPAAPPPPPLLSLRAVHEACAGALRGALPHGGADVECEVAACHHHAASGHLYLDVCDGDVTLKAVAEALAREPRALHACMQRLRRRASDS